MLRSAANGHSVQGHESMTKGAAWVDGLLNALSFMRHSSADAPGWMAKPKECAAAAENTLKVLADEYLDLHVGYVLSTACDHLNVNQDFGGKKKCAPIFADLAGHFDGDKDYVAWCEQTAVALDGVETGAGTGDACHAGDVDCVEQASQELEGLKEKEAKGESIKEAEFEHVEHKVGSGDVQVGDAPFGSGGPFGGKSKADEYTGTSKAETEEMIDQMERAQAAEEKRASYRALTRLRGVMTSSYDNIAHTHMANIHEYNEKHNWRKENHIRHLAEEEAGDVAKWTAQGQR